MQNEDEIADKILDAAVARMFEEETMKALGQTLDPTVSTHARAIDLGAMLDSMASMMPPWLRLSVTVHEVPGDWLPKDSGYVVSDDPVVMVRFLETTPAPNAWATDARRGHYVLIVRAGLIDLLRTASAGTWKGVDSANIPTQEIGQWLVFRQLALHDPKLQAQYAIWQQRMSQPAARPEQPTRKPDGPDPIMGPFPFGS